MIPGRGLSPYFLFCELQAGGGLLFSLFGFLSIVCEKIVQSMCTEPLNISVEVYLSVQDTMLIFFFLIIHFWDKGIFFDKTQFFVMPFCKD